MEAECIISPNKKCWARILNYIPIDVGLIQFVIPNVVYKAIIELVVNIPKVDSNEIIDFQIFFTTFNYKLLYFESVILDKETYINSTVSFFFKLNFFNKNSFSHGINTFLCL